MTPQKLIVVITSLAGGAIGLVRADWRGQVAAANRT